MAGTVTVNNFFAHWIREINIVRYGDEKPIFLKTNMVDVYRYLDELLKLNYIWLITYDELHMPKKDLTAIENNLLYC